MATTKSLALVGAGRWGRNLARNFHALKALHTICDTDQSLLAAYKEEYPDVQTTRDFPTALQSKEITQIAIAAPAALHYSLAKEALLAGKDVYVEKPLCLCSKEGEELVHLASERKLVLMVGHLLQYHPVVNYLQDLVIAGELGKLYSITSHRLNLGQIRTEESNLWSFAPHDISVILSLVGGSLPLSAATAGHSYLTEGVADFSLTTMEFPYQVRAHIYTSWIHPFKEQKLVVIGSEGMAVFDDTKPWEEKLFLYRQPISWKEGKIPYARKVEGEKVAVPQKEPLHEECAHFLECCRERKHPKSDGQEGLRVLQVLEAAQKSMESGGEKQTVRCAPSNYFAHPTAVVDKGAMIGEGTKIWHFTHIMDKAIVGSNCNIGQNVVVSPGAVLGANVKVQNNVSVYTGVTCESDVFLGPSMVFTNVINPRSCVNRRGDYQETIVRRGTTIGANATIVCGNELGAYSFIGAGAVVLNDVKPFALMVGNPARQIGWMSRHGERLDLPVSLEEGKAQSASCPATGEVYTLKGDNLFPEAHESIHVETSSL